MFRASRNLTRGLQTINIFYCASTAAVNTIFSVYINSTIASADATAIAVLPATAAHPDVFLGGRLRVF